MKANEKCYDIWKMGKKVRLGFWFRFLLIIYAVILSFSFNSDPNLKTERGQPQCFRMRSQPVAVLCMLYTNMHCIYTRWKHAISHFKWTERERAREPESGHWTDDCIRIVVFLFVMLNKRKSFTLRHSHFAMPHSH